MKNINWIKMTKTEISKLKHKSQYLITFVFDEPYVGLGYWDETSKCFCNVDFDTDINVNSVIAYVEAFPYEEK